MSVPIVFVLPEAERYSSDGGAIATVTHELASALSRAGEDSMVISPSFLGVPYRGGTVVMLRRSGDTASRGRRFARRVLARALPQRFGQRARYLAGVRTALSRRDARVVVVSNDPLLAAELARDGRRPVVLWLHNYLQGAEADALRRVPATVQIVAVSDSVSRWTAEQLGDRANRVVTISNAVNHELFHPRDRTPRAEGRLEVVCHGRIDPNKGQLVAVRAAALAAARGAVGLRLTVLGGALSFGHPSGAQERYEAELRDAAAETGAVLTGRVRADEVGERLRAFDVALVLPLVPEPFGLVAIEAMASGCAVVAAPTGGLADVVGDAALLVEPEVAQVADALLRICAEDGLLESLQRRAIARARAFSWDAAAEELVALTRDAIRTETAS